MGDHFIEHVNVVFRNVLLRDYKQLAKWENGLGNEYRLKMNDKLERLRMLIFAQEREATYRQEPAVKSRRRDNKEEERDKYQEQAMKYKMVDMFVDEWHDSLVELKDSDVMPYEKAIVEEIDKFNRKINANVQAMSEPEYVVMLEGLNVDSFSGTGSATGGTYKTRFPYNKRIKKTRPLIVNKYDKDILDSEGFDHHPELQMLPLSIKEVRDEVYDVISTKADEGEDKIGSRGNFFFVGLGGGTGTGVISPLAEQFGKGSRGYFTLGILGGKDDNKYLSSQQPWFRRCFNILLALNDLIATANLDGILLVDNEILMDRLKARRELSENKAVLSDRGELKKFLKEEFGMDWVDPETQLDIKKTGIIHIYDAENFAEINIDEGGKRAILKISDGRIYNLRVKEEKGKRMIYGKAYAEKIDEELTRVIYPAFGRTACEKKGTDVDWGQLKDAMRVEGQDQKSPIFVPCYASDKNKTTAELIKEALDNGMFANCKYENADKIIVYVVGGIRDEDAIENILSERFAKTTDIRIIKRDAEREEVLRNVSAKIIVFESKTSKEEGEESYLFTIDAELEADLDTEYPSEKLKNAFKTKKGITLHENVNLKKVDDNVWEIIDKWENHSYIYKIKKEDDKLNIYEEIKENEVLLLLRNCNVKNTLYKRLEVAQSFVDLLVAFKDLIKEKKEQSLSSTEMIARGIIKEIIKGKNGESGEKVEQILEKIPPDGIVPAYLFSWDRITQKDKEEAENNELKRSLREFFDIGWTEDLIINSTDKKIICEPADNAEGRPVITIEKKAGEIAILKIGDDNYNLTIKEENGEQKVYERENRASEKRKILQEAKRFLLPSDIGPQKREETYKDQVEIVANLKAVVNDAIENLDDGTIPIFTNSIFKTKSAAASKDEVILATIFKDIDTYSTYCDMLGDDKVNQLFNDFQREVLEDRAYVENSGDTADYILTDIGENVLAEGLRKGLDAVSKPIEPSDLLKVIGIKKFLEFVREAGITTRGISFPKLLVLSCLYTKWECVFSWDINSGINEKELRKVLSEDIGIYWAENNGILENLDEKTLYIPKDENNPVERIEILIDENAEKGERLLKFLKEIRGINWAENAEIRKSGDGKVIRIFTDEDSVEIELKEEKATLKISDDETYNLKVKNEDDKLNIYRDINLDSDDIPLELGIEFLKRHHHIPKDHSWNNEGNNWWTIRGNNRDRENHYIKREGENLIIYPDIIHELKVKKAADGTTLKIYKRRGDDFIPAKADGEAKIE
jgi:hypothetical protein